MRQNTLEWFHARCGNATASRFKDIMSMTKSGPSASRKRYMIELITERLTGEPIESYITQDMIWGMDHEAMAREALEIELGIMVDQVGFIQHPEIGCGASPDGLTDDYTIEIKCPKTTTHVETMLNGMPAQHKAQVQGQMWLADRAKALFVSFDPRMPDDLRLYVQTINRDEGYIEKLKSGIKGFLDELAETEIKIKEKHHEMPEMQT